MIAAALLALQLLPAPDSVRWEEVNSDPAGRNAIDPASVRRDGDIVRFTMRVIFHDPARYEGINMLISRLVFECGQRTFSIEAADAYGEDGRRTFSQVIPPGDARPAPMSTVDGHEAMRVRICGADAA